MSSVVRVGGCGIVMLALAALAAGPTAAQAVPAAAEAFAEAWGGGEEEALRLRFAATSRLTVDGVSHAGIRPEQAVAALRDLLTGHERAVPVVVRAETMESRDGAGFAELLWETRERAAGTPVRRTILITFTRVEATLLASDVRIMP